MRVWRVEPGEEVLRTLNHRAAAESVANAAIVALIGAVDGCRISNMSASDASSDVISELTQPFELSGTGEIVNGQVHLHVSLSGEGNAALHGHLHEARVGTWYVAAYVLEMN